MIIIARALSINILRISSKRQSNWQESLGGSSDRWGNGCFRNHVNVLILNNINEIRRTALPYQTNVIKRETCLTWLWSFEGPLPVHLGNYIRLYFFPGILPIRQLLSPGYETKSLPSSNSIPHLHRLFLRVCNRASLKPF